MNLRLDKFNSALNFVQMSGAVKFTVLYYKILSTVLWAKSVFNSNNNNNSIIQYLRIGCSYTVAVTESPQKFVLFYVDYHRNFIIFKCLWIFAFDVSSRSSNAISSHSEEQTEIKIVVWTYCATSV